MVYTQNDINNLNPSQRKVGIELMQNFIHICELNGIIFISLRTSWKILSCIYSLNILKA